jgi:hypothetical protein
MTAPKNEGVLDLERLQALLDDSLAMWNVPAVVGVDESLFVAIVITTDGRRASVEACCDPSTPFRWIVRWCDANGAADAAPGGQFHRGCASLVGVLSALRGVFEVHLGDPVRIASAASQ